MVSCRIVGGVRVPTMGDGGYQRQTKSHENRVGDVGRRYLDKLMTCRLRKVTPFIFKSDRGH